MQQNVFVITQEKSLTQIIAFQKYKEMNKDPMSPDTQVISHQFNIEFGLSCAAIFQFEWCNGHQSWNLTQCRREVHSVDYKVWRYYRYEVQAPQ